jgi:hypothetical protein
LVCKGWFKTRSELICNNFVSFRTLKPNTLKNVFFNYQLNFNSTHILKKKTIDIFNKLKFIYLKHKLSLINSKFSFNYKLNIYKCLKILHDIQISEKISKYNSLCYAFGRIYVVDNISRNYQANLIFNFHKILLGNSLDFFTKVIYKKTYKFSTKRINIKRRLKVNLKVIFLYLFYLIKFFKKYLYKIGTYPQFYTLFKILDFFLFNELFLKKLFIRYNRFFKYFKYFKLKYNYKFFQIFRNIALYSFKYFNNLTFLILKRKRLKIYLDNQTVLFKSLIWNQTKFGFNRFLKLALNYNLIINLINIFYNLFYFKFKKHYKKFLKKRFSKIVRFSDLIKYNLNLSFKTYNTLIFSLLIKFKNYLKRNFYYILYKYTNKDQKIFFDLYLYIYKGYNKNFFLNNLNFAKLKHYKALTSMWFYKNLQLLKLNFNNLKIKKPNRFIFSFFINYLKRHKHRQFFLNIMLKKLKNSLFKNYLKFIIFKYYKLTMSRRRYARNVQKKKHFFGKFKTLKYSGLVFNKNKFSNLFLLNTKPEYFNVLNLPKKCFYNVCLFKKFY